MLMTRCRRRPISESLADQLVGDETEQPQSGRGQVDHHDRASSCHRLATGRTKLVSVFAESPQDATVAFAAVFYMVLYRVIFIEKY
jgi:hypothetical protein